MEILRGNFGNYQTIIAPELNAIWIGILIVIVIVIVVVVLI